MIHLQTVRYVRYMHMSPTVRCFDLRGNSIELGSAPRCQDHAGSFISETQSDGFADPSTAANYNGNFILQPLPSSPMHWFFRPVVHEAILSISAKVVSLLSDPSRRCQYRGNTPATQPRIQETCPGHLQRVHSVSPRRH